MRPGQPQTAFTTHDRAPTWNEWVQPRPIGQLPRYPTVTNGQPATLRGWKLWGEGTRELWTCWYRRNARLFTQFTDAELLTARRGTVARTSSVCASTGGGGLTWASTAALSRKASSWLSSQAHVERPAGDRFPACRTPSGPGEARTRPPPLPRFSGTAALRSSGAPRLLGAGPDFAPLTAAPPGALKATPSPPLCGARACSPGVAHIVQPQETPAAANCRSIYA